ncbi:GntR family transcriptional regulator [Streptomyces massasporeus]
MRCRWVGETGHAALPRYEYVKLADAIAADIAAGELPQGAALPGERAMTELYGVSIGTVRRAVVELRTRGLVATLPVKGTYVIGLPEPVGDAPEGSEPNA